MDLKTAIRSRRTIQVFSKIKVSEEFIEQAIQAANYAPCHHLTFPWRFTSVSQEHRELLAKLALEIKFGNKKIDQKIIEKLYEKFLNPSHLLVVSQVLASDLKTMSEDYAACACAIQNLSLFLTSKGIGSKWSTGKIINNENTYRIAGIDSTQENIIGLIFIGYGSIPPKINRPSIKTIYRRL